MAYPKRRKDDNRNEGDRTQRLVCPSMHCSAEGWQVERDTSRRDTWIITAETGGTAWVIAASGPICPLCGEDLADRHEAALEQGPFGAFVRSLAA
jgi:hypothetical protein